MNIADGKLLALESRFEEINEKMADPDVINDTAKYTELMKEHAALSPTVEKFREYKKYVSDRDQTLELLNESGLDKELRALAQEELELAKENAERALTELRILMLPKDKNDEKNVILEIRGGAGGDEAALFAAVLTRMYTMYSATKGWQVSEVSKNETELGGIKEIVMMIEGMGAYSKLKYESGVHRVQRVPETEASGRIHTSTVTVAVMPEAEDVELTIDPNDLKIDTFRAGGAGGQHINKTDSAIRITHIPTGMVVECQDERSQYKNKDKAMKVLRSRLYDNMVAERNEAIASDRKQQVGTGDRSERIRTYNYPQGRVTDHRIGLTLYKLDAVLNGDVDALVEPLTDHYRAELLAAEEK